VPANDILSPWRATTPCARRCGHLASEGFGLPSGWVRIRQADVEAHESLDLEAVKDFIERHDGRVDEPPVYQSRAMGSGQWGGKHRFPLRSSFTVRP
jgi:hypothetical protein